MKLKLRYFLNPLRTMNTLSILIQKKVNKTKAKILTSRQFKDIKRNERLNCWCGGELLPFHWHPRYKVCKECRCFVNAFPPTLESLRTVYAFDNYWHQRQKFKGHPMIERRPESDQADGRVDYWMDLIAQYGPKCGTVIEAGCGSGVLLTRLQRRGFRCIGVEPDSVSAAKISTSAGLDVQTGFFPNLDLPACDLFLAFDVLEHCLNPLEFMHGISKVISEKGTIILQTPIFRNGTFPPFKEIFDAVFDDVEHQFIFTSDSIKKLCNKTGFKIIAEDAWQLSHEILILKKS